MAFFKVKEAHKTTSVCFCRILVVVDKLVSDCKSKSIIEFINYCNANSVSVTVLSERYEIRHLIKDGVDCVEAKKFCFDSRIGLCETIVSLCRKRHIDVVCNCCDEHFATVIFAAKMCHVTNVLFCYNIPDVSSRAKYVCSKSLAMSDAIFSFSHSASSFLLDNYEFDVKKMHHFNVSINVNLVVDDFIGTGRVCNVLGELGDVANHKKILVCFCDYRDVESNISVLKALCHIKERSDFILIFVGSFDKTKNERNILLEMIKKHSLQHCTRLTDSAKDMNALLSLAYAVFCFQSDEFFTNFYCATGLMKKPYIACRTSNTEKAIVSGKNGFFVKKNIVADIYGRILEILEMPVDRYNYMCSYASAYAKKYFSDLEMKKRVYEIILGLSSATLSPKKDLKKNVSFFKSK